MILCDREIRDIMGHGRIDPWDDDNVQPASYDITLGSSFRVFHSHEVGMVDTKEVMKLAKLTQRHNVEPGNPFVVHPGEFCLAASEEFIMNPAHLTARLDGKSSLGRLGLVVHATAGYIDPGFHGNITLEVTNLLRVPIKLWPGMPIGQLSFHKMSRIPDEPYDGHYQGDKGATASRLELA